MEPGYVVINRVQLIFWRLTSFFISREERARESAAASLPLPLVIGRDSVRVYPVAILPKIAEHHASITKYL